MGYHRKNVPKIVYAKKVIEVKTEKLANRIYKDRKAHTLKYLVLLKYMEWWFLIFVNVPYRNKHILCTAPQLTKSSKVQISFRIPKLTT